MEEENMTDVQIKQENDNEDNYWNTEYGYHISENYFSEINIKKEVHDTDGFVHYNVKEELTSDRIKCLSEETSCVHFDDSKNIDTLSKNTDKRNCVTHYDVLKTVQNDIDITVEEPTINIEYLNHECKDPLDISDFNQLQDGKLLVVLCSSFSYYH